MIARPGAHVLLANLIQPGSWTRLTPAPATPASLAMLSGMTLQLLPAKAAILLFGGFFWFVFVLSCSFCGLVRRKGKGKRKRGWIHKSCEEWQFAKKSGGENKN